MNSSVANRLAVLLRGPLPVIALLVVHLALGLSAARRMAMTFDEGIHITGGVSYWTTGDYRLHPENGNWSQRIVSLPAWLGGFTLPRFAGPAWQAADVRALDEQFFYGAGNDADTLLGCCRLMMAIPSALLALLVYLWSRRLFGPAGGLVSLTLYAFSPTMLANGFLTTSDVFATLFFTAAIAALWSLLHRVTPLSIALTCVMLAGLILCKSSGLLVIPMGLLMAGVRLMNSQPLVVACGKPREIRGRAPQLAIFAALAVAQVLGVALIVWGSYGFRYSAFATGEDTAQFEIPWHDVESGVTPLLKTALQFAQRAHALPEAYIYGLAQLMLTKERIGFLHGQMAWAGSALFFPTALAIKSPLELFALLGLSVWACLSRRGTSRLSDKHETKPLRMNRLFALAPLVVLLVVYWCFALQSGLNIGHRHILPIYPPLFILAGGAGLWFVAPRSTAIGTADANQTRGRPASEGAGRQKRIARLLVVVLLAANAAETFWIWPNYLSYFNVLSGGSGEAYRWLVDSSLDWGQSLKDLPRWLDEHPDDARDARRVYLSYFGVAHPDYYDIRAELLPSKGIAIKPAPPRKLSGGLYCASATMLQQVYSRPRGRWNVEYEALYQVGRRFIADLEQDGHLAAEADDKLDAPRSAEELQACELFAELRWARLCSFLRAREPDDNVGHSILIYRLSDAEVVEALDGPPCELLPRPETESATATDSSSR